MKYQHLVVECRVSAASPALRGNLRELRAKSAVTRVRERYSLCDSVEHSVWSVKTSEILDTAPAVVFSRELFPPGAEITASGLCRHGIKADKSRFEH